MDQANICKIHDLPLTYSLLADGIHFSDICQTCSKANFTVISHTQQEQKLRTAQVFILKSYVNKFELIKQLLSFNSISLKGQGKILSAQIDEACSKIISEIKMLDESIDQIEPNEVFKIKLKKTEERYNLVVEGLKKHIQALRIVQNNYIEKCKEIIDGLEIIKIQQ